MDVTAGTRLGRYEVLELIGAGGMGEVYKARDTRLGRTVALKILPPRLATDPARRRRFEKEARAVSSLEHPHICVLHDVGSEQGVDYLVLEHLEGQTLAERLVRGKLPREEALPVAIQIADALDAAHQKGVVHRDLKPGNIMLARSGVKLLDFGLARLRGDGSGEEESTVSQTDRAARIAGTLPYMSPEQVSGAKVDGRSDVWALGVVLYEMLTGRRPFQGGSAATLTAAILEADPPSLSTADAPMPPAVEHVVRRCLAKDVDSRWQSARDVATELSWISEGRVSAARPAVQSRRRWGASAAVAALLLMAVGAAAWWGRVRGAKPSLDPKRVVVAVFENRGGDASLDPLGQTLADSIVDGLPRIQGVSVVPGSKSLPTGPRTPGETDAGRDSIQQLARETSAGLVVSGTYTLAADELRIQARLTDARSGRFQALDPTNGPRAAPMTAVEAARQRVLGAVAVRVDPNWLGPPDTSPPTYEAYQEYRTSIETGDNPISHVRRALELDPDFVTARIDLISASFASGNYPEAARHVAVLQGRKARLTPMQRLLVDAFGAWLAGRTGEAYLAAREVRKLWPEDPGAAFVSSWFAQNAYRFREAVEILTAPLDWERFHGRSPRRGIAYFFNLTVMLHELGEHERELAEVHRGQRLHPEISWLHEQEAHALTALGRLDEMERVVAQRLSLASPGQRGHFLLYVGLELRAHGQQEAATKTLVRSLEALQACSAEEARETRGDLALLLRLAGRLDEARTVYEQLARETPGDTEKAIVWAGNRGIVAALRGDRAEALRISDELGRLTRPFLFGVNTYERFLIAAQLGEKKQAVDLLRTAMAQGFILSWESTGLHQEPLFETLRGYPPFEEVIRPQ